jgi:hypothetical protein
LKIASCKLDMALPLQVRWRAGSLPHKGLGLPRVMSTVVHGFSVPLR